MLQRSKPTNAVQSRRRHYRGRVVNRREISPGCIWIDLAVEQFAGARPGQFVVVQCSDVADQLTGQVWQDSSQWPCVSSGELRTRLALLRRPFSIADMPYGADGCRLSLQFRILGPGTIWLAENAHTGAELRMIGPLGNGFKIEDVQRAILLAGGMGAAPMPFLARELTNRGSDVVLLAGAKSQELLPFALSKSAIIDKAGEPSLCSEFFSELGVKVSISTDDGSVGRLGLLSDTLADYLSRHTELSETNTVMYACGPEAMMANVAQIAKARQLPCQVCLERYMACGMGACQSCVCRAKSETAPDGWAYKLVCTDGPVFDGQSILW